MEGQLFWARFVVLERGISPASEYMESLLKDARNHLAKARYMCTLYPGQTKGILAEVEEVEKMLRKSTFYAPVTNAEKAAVYAAMASEFRGTGHWYYCENNRSRLENVGCRCRRLSVRSVAHQLGVRIIKLLVV